MPHKAIQVLGEFTREHESIAALTGLAGLLCEQRRYVEMERALQAVEIKDPLRGSVPLIRGTRYMQEGRYEDACRELERAIEIDPQLAGSKAEALLSQARSAIRNR